MIMTELNAALLLFMLTAILGMYLSSRVLRGLSSVKPVIIIHAVFSIIGFCLLLLEYPKTGKSLLWLTLATGCGVILLYQDMTRQKFTKWLCYAHAVFTIVGLVYLCQSAPWFGV